MLLKRGVLGRESVNRLFGDLFLSEPVFNNSYSRRRSVPEKLIHAGVLVQQLLAHLGEAALLL